MAKGSSSGLTKLKCMLKKWHSARSKLSRTSSTIAANPCENTWQSASVRGHVSENGLQPVYVGKSRRRYMISSHLVDHPIFRVLAEKSSSPSDDADPTIVVGCEVVLFEHLLWMLDNADPQLESMDDLVEFYAC